MFLCGTIFLWVPSFTFFLFNSKTEGFLLKKLTFSTKFAPLLLQVIPRAMKRQIIRNALLQNVYHRRLRYFLSKEEFGQQKNSRSFLK